MFKMNGYIWSAHEEQSYEPIPPVSAAQIWSYTHTRRPAGLSQPPDRPLRLDGNDNFSYPQQANFFLAGRYYGRLGGFIMGTYSGVDNKWAMDNVDVRLSDVHTFGEKHTLLYGATFNNGPTVQDAWNTLPAWSQLIGSEVAPGPAASPSISNLIAQVAGVGAYAFWDNFLYAEVTPYVSGKSGPSASLTAGNHEGDRSPTASRPTGASRSTRTRAATRSRSGTSACTTRSTSRPPRPDQQLPRSRRRHPVPVERQAALRDLPDGVHLGEPGPVRRQGGQRRHAAASSDLHTCSSGCSYYYNNLAGITFSLFDIAGPRDRVLYAPDRARRQSDRASPNTWGGFVQLNFLPFSQWFDLRWPALPMTQLAVQYTFYGKFNGARPNYDGFGRSASDNNTLYLLAWTPW